MGVTAGVSFGLVTVGVLDILMTDREAATVMHLERCLVSGGWVAFPFFRFGMTTDVTVPLIYNFTFTRVYTHGTTQYLASKNPWFAVEKFFPRDESWHLAWHFTT